MRRRAMRPLKYLSACAGFVTLALCGCSSQNQEKVAAASDKTKQELSRAAEKTKHAAALAKKDLTDGTISIKVKSAMLESDKLDTTSVNVDTKDRVTHIKGTVPTAEMKNLAGRIASDTVGKDVRV